MSTRTYIFKRLLYLEGISQGINKGNFPCLGFSHFSYIIYDLRGLGLVTLQRY